MSGFSQTNEKIAVGLQNVVKEVIVLEASVADIETAGLQAFPELPGFAALPVGERHLIGHGVEDVELGVQTHVALAGAVIDGPGDSGSHGEETAIDGQEFAGDGIQAPIVRLETGSFAERLNQRQQQLGIKKALGIRESALGQAGDMIPLANPGILKSIFNGPQTSNAGVEESQQMADDDMVQEDLAIAVNRLLVEQSKLLLDQTNESTADDLIFRPRYGCGGRRRVFTLASHGLPLKPVDNQGAS